MIANAITYCRIIISMLLLVFFFCLAQNISVRRCFYWRVMILMKKVYNDCFHIKDINVEKGHKCLKLSKYRLRIFHC